MIELNLYMKELFDFLKTVTVKNDLLADQMLALWVKPEIVEAFTYVSTDNNRRYHAILQKYGIDNGFNYPEETEFPLELHPYYRNLKGDIILKDYKEIELALGIDRSKLSQTEYQRLYVEKDVEGYAARYGLSRFVEYHGKKIPNVYLYQKFNHLVFIHSYDTTEKIPFCLGTIGSEDHARTTEVYKIPNDGFSKLVKENPEEADLIKSIVYPLEQSAQELKVLPRFSIIGGDYNLLEKQERASMRSAIEEFVTYFRKRWDVPQFAYEDLYAVAQQGIIFGALCSALYNQRMRNIKTRAAHTFHVWSYLKSHGLEDYREVLTTSQALFLYRNIRHLLMHKGTAYNFDILNFALLFELGFYMTNKTAAQDITTLTDDTVAHPEIVATDVCRKVRNLWKTYHLDSADYLKMINLLGQLAGTDDDSNLSEWSRGEEETIEGTYAKERGAGLEYQEDALYNRSTAKQTEQLSRTAHTALRTKLLEIHKADSSDLLAKLYARYVTEAYLYRASIGHLIYYVTFTEPLTKAVLTMSAKELIAMIYYCTYQELYHKELRDKILYPPNVATLTVPYKVDPDPMPEHTITYDQKYRTDRVMTEYGYKHWPNHSYKLVSRDKAVMAIDDEALHFVELYLETHHDGASTLTDATWECLCARSAHGPVTLDLLDGLSYQQFISGNELLQNVIERAEASDDRKIAYGRLGNAFADALFNVENQYNLDTVQMMTYKMQKIKELFVSLCSYNIAIIEEPINPLDSHDLFNLTIASYKTINTKTSIELPTATIKTSHHAEIPFVDTEDRARMFSRYSRPFVMNVAFDSIQ